MRKLGPSASLVSAVTLLTILGLAPPVSAEQAETAPPGVAVADGERSSESSADPGATRVRRTVRSPIRDPWSAGVRVLWSSVGAGPGGGGGLPPTTGGSPPLVLGSCSASGSCAPNSLRLAGGAPGVATTGNGSPVQGVAFDAGRLVTSGVEVGIGLDLTTHPGQAPLSNVQGVGFRTATREDSALQVLTGERAVQLDLAARLTYRPRGDDRMVRGVSSGPTLRRYRSRDVAIFPRVLHYWRARFRRRSSPTLGRGAISPPSIPGSRTSRSTAASWCRSRGGRRCWTSTSGTCGRRTAASTWGASVSVPVSATGSDCRVGTIHRLRCTL